MPSSSSGSHSELVIELAEEFLERYRKGERPSLKEYVDRHPALASEIREVFPAMAMMENIALGDESLTGAPISASALPMLQRLGDYRIIREVGRGGMGVVYEAEQVSLGRHVALKVLPNNTLVEPRHKRRFEREAKAAAKLHHTNIVPVFGVGEEDGVPYYAMQFIQGLGMNEVLEELKRLQGKGTPALTAELPVSRRDLSAADMARSLLTGHYDSAASGDDDEQAQAAPRTAGSRTVDQPAFASAPGTQTSTRRAPDPSSLNLSGSSVVLPGQSDDTKRSGKRSYWHSIATIGVQVAGALDYAHHQGILHRDIKPSNLLLDTRGTVWVTDFGLAKADDQQNLTTTGDILGTLRYMPPEAFEGRTDRRSDVYALGLTLYELLAMRPAFGEKDRHRLIKQVTSTEVSRLDAVNSAIPRDLVTIVHKAIDRDPAHRYPNAGELADDLRRYLDDEPIHARRLSALERCGRWCRRNPLVASLIAALVLVAGSALYNMRAAQTTSFALTKQVAETNESNVKLRKATDETTAANAKLSRSQEVQRAQFHGIQMSLIQAAWDDGNVSEVLRRLDELKPGPDQTDMRGLEWHIFDRLCHSDLRTVALDDRITSTNAVFSDDGTRLFSINYFGMANSGVKIFDTATGKTVGAFPLDLGGAITTKGGKANTTAIKTAVNQNGTRIALVSGGSTTSPLFDSGGFGPGGFSPAPPAGLVFDSLAKGQDSIAISTSPQGLKPQLEQWAKDNKITGDVITREQFTAFYQTTVVGSNLLPGTADIFGQGPTPTFLNMNPFRTTKASPRVTPLRAFGAANFVGVIASLQGGGSLLGAPSPFVGLAPVKTPKGGKGPGTGGKGKATPQPDKDLPVQLKVLDVATGKAVFAIKLDDTARSTTERLVLSPDGSKLVWYAGGAKPLEIWDVANSEIVASIETKIPKTAGWSLAFSADGERLAGFNSDALLGQKRIVVWETSTGEEIADCPVIGPVTDLKFSPNGQQIAAVCRLTPVLMLQTELPLEYTGHIEILDVDSGEEVRKIPVADSTGAGLVPYVRFSRDGTLLAGIAKTLGAGSGNGAAVSIWNLATGKKTRTLRGHTDFIMDIAPAASDQGFLTASFDGTIKEWDAAGLDELRPSSIKGFERFADAKGKAKGKGGAGGPGGGGKGGAGLLNTSNLIVNDEGTRIAVWKNATTTTTIKQPTTLLFLGDRRPLAATTWSLMASPLGQGPLLAASALISGATKTKGGKGGKAKTPDPSEIGVMDFRAQKLVPIKDYKGLILHVALSPNGKLGAALTYFRGAVMGDKLNNVELRVWDTATGKTLFTQPIPVAYSQSATGVITQRNLIQIMPPPVFSPDGKLLANIAIPGQILDHHWVLQIRDAETGKIVATTDAMETGFLSLQFSPDGKTLGAISMQVNPNAKGGPGGILNPSALEVTAWDTANGKKRWGYVAPALTPVGFTFTGDSSRLAANFIGPPPKVGDNVVSDEVHLLDCASGKMLQKFSTGTFGPIVGPLTALSRDGKWLAFVTYPKGNINAGAEIEVWDVDRGEKQWTLQGHRGVMDLAFTPDGRRLATCDDNAKAEVKLWDMTTGHQLLSLKTDKRAGGLQISPDGHRLIMLGTGAGEMGLPTLWNGEPVRRGK